MNWKQLHSSATHEEQLKTVVRMLHAIEEREQRVVFSRGRLVRERRGTFRGAHFINDRRRLRPRLTRMISLVGFAFTLTTVSVATWLFVLHAPSQLAAIALAMHIFMLSIILHFKPYNRLQPTTT